MDILFNNAILRGVSNYLYLTTILILSETLLYKFHYLMLKEETITFYIYKRLEIISLKVNRGAFFEKALWQKINPIKRSAHEQIINPD